MGVGTKRVKSQDELAGRIKRLKKGRAEEWKEEHAGGPSVTKQASILGHTTVLYSFCNIPVGSVDGA